MKKQKSQYLGWFAVSMTLTICGLWTYWGTIENFHEGWYSKSLFENLFMFIFQYLSVTIVFILLALIALRWKKIGIISHVIFAGFAIGFFFNAHFVVLWLMIVFPILGLGLLYYFGTPKPLVLARYLIVGIPLLILVIISIPYGIKISNRLNDEDRGLILIETNSITLAWAPRGPGWPDEGMTWYEAKERCLYLSLDGTMLMDEIQNIWRLPTIDEAVSSMMIHGVSAGGMWDEERHIASYEKTPDKESPLWDIYSEVIYYWTSETYENDDRRAYIIVYHGGVYLKMKTDGQNYLSFRAVKNV